MRPASNIPFSNSLSMETAPGFLDDDKEKSLEDIP